MICKGVFSSKSVEIIQKTTASLDILYYNIRVHINIGGIFHELSFYSLIKTSPPYLLCLLIAISINTFICHSASIFILKVDAFFICSLVDKPCFSLGCCGPPIQSDFLPIKN